MKHNPCQGGLNQWLKDFPDGVEWTLDGQILFIKSECRRYLWWLRDNKKVPMWDMSHADLIHAIGLK